MRANVTHKPTECILLSLAVLCLSGCGLNPKVPYSTEFDPAAELAESGREVTDGRGRFREIFCTILEEHGRDLPDYMPCEEALTRVGAEPPPSGQPVYLGPTADDYLIGLVPGLGWECIKGWLDFDNSGPDHLNDFGYDTTLVEVDGLSGIANNARQINEFLTGLPAEYNERHFILLGYSKGAPDLLEFLVTYPQTADRVVAVVALAGAVWGSPLAIEGTQDQAELLTKVPRSQCDEGDGGAVESLRPHARRKWMQTHTLPEHIRYYSVVTYPDPKSRMSAGLKPGYRELAKRFDARNDSQVIFADQVIPGSKLLAFPNADHWAMAVPVARQHKFAAWTFVNHNEYPREAFFEAIIRYIEEDLAE